MRQAYTVAKGRYTCLRTSCHTHHGLLMTTPSIPDRLDGEPDFRPGSVPKVFLFILQLNITVLLLLPVYILCSLFYVPLRLFFARPPTVVSPR